MLQRLYHVLHTCFGLLVKAGVAASAGVQYMIMALIKTGCIAASCNGAARLPVTAEIMHSGYRKALLFTFLLTLLPVSAHALTPPGTVISSTATATFDIGGPVVTAASNTVDVVTSIIQTPSTTLIRMLLVQSARRL